MLVLAFFGFTAETLVADVHDGDATDAELAVYGGAHSDEAPPQASLAVLVAAAPTTLDQGSISALPSAPGDAPDQSEHGGHAYHSCHCAHAHGGAPTAATPPSFAEREGFAPSIESVLMPPSAAHELSLRPPIA